MTSLLPRTLALALFVSLSVALPVAATSCPSVVWTPKQSVSGYSSYVESFETIDYDHDGKLDLVGTIRTDQAVVTLNSWRGVGDGTFETPLLLSTENIIDLEVGNVNNDAYPDLVGGNFNNTFWVRLGNATGFDAPVYTATNYSAYEVSVVNLGGDAFTDLLVSSFTSNIFVLYQGAGNGTYTEVQRQNAGAVTFDVTGSVLADLDGDTRLDVAVSRRSSETLAVFFRNADSSFAAPVLLPVGTFPDDIQAADFDEDGLLDLVATEWEDGNIDVFLNLGGRAFAPRLVLPGAPPGEHGGLNAFRLLDVNDDANVDILAAGVNGNWLTTYLGVGDGTFASANWYQTSTGSLLAIATGDFDADTDIDVALGAFEQHFTLSNTCATQITLYSVSPVITSGQPAPLRALVSGISAQTPQPLGTVTFKEGPTTHGTVPLNENGVASLDVTGLSLGDHTLTAEFSGNSVLTAATSPSMVQKVTNNTTTTTLFLPPSSVYGTPYTFDVELRRQDFNFTFQDYYILNVDGVESERYNGAPVTLNLSVGPHTLSAKYLGSEWLPPSQSAQHFITTIKATPTATKSGDSNVRLGTAHNVQITINTPPGTSATGFVTLRRGTTVLGSGPVTSNVANISVTLPRGGHDVIASYSGDDNFNAATVAFTLSVVQNVPLAIDARGLQNAISIHAVVPVGTTAMTLFRRAAGTIPWTAVGGWSMATALDPTSLSPAVLYDYRLDATVSGNPQSSNIDSALMFSDDALVPTVTLIRYDHVYQLRDAINAQRTAAGLPAFGFDSSLALQPVRATHVTAMRNALTEARTALGMFTVTFTDPSLSPGMQIKAAHIQELREAAR
jgi:hypothetical protein